MSLSYANYSSSATISGGTVCHHADASGGSVVLTLVDANDNDANHYYFTRSDTNVATSVTLVPVNSQLINGASGAVVTNALPLHLQAANGNWVILGYA